MDNTDNIIFSDVVNDFKKVVNERDQLNEICIKEIIEKNKLVRILKDCAKKYNFELPKNDLFVSEQLNENNSKSHFIKKADNPYILKYSEIMSESINICPDNTVNENKIDELNLNDKLQDNIVLSCNELSINNTNQQLNDISSGNYIQQKGLYKVDIETNSIFANKKENKFYKFSEPL